MNLLHRIIILQKKSYLRGQKKQQKIDAIILQKTKENYAAIINTMLENQSNELLQLQKNCDDVVKIITESKEKELIAQQDFYKKEIERLTRNHENAISAIRNQEKRHYEPIITERNNEIARLNEEKAEQKKYYKSILDYGIAMEASGERAAGFFSRAQSKVKEAAECAVQSQSKFAEAMQLVERGNSCVETIQNTVGKTTPRLLRNIKE